LCGVTLGESVVASLVAKVEAGTAAAPCDKAAAPGPAAGPRQFLDIRLPVVVDDYHPPVGGFNPSHIPDKEVDVAARSILREIQAAEAEAKANGDEPQKQTQDGILTTEEHKALKQLLLDSDILVRAAAKALAENGPIEAAAAKKVATSAVAKAAKLEKKANVPSKPINKIATAAAAAAAPKLAVPTAAPKAPAVTAPAPVSGQAKTTTTGTKSDKAIKRVGAAAPAPVSAKGKSGAPADASGKAIKRT
jgi:hypothetical protein